MINTFLCVNIVEPDSPQIII